MRLVSLIPAAAAVLLWISSCSKSTPSTTSSTTPASAPPAVNASAQVGSVAGSAAAGAIVILVPKTPRELPPSDQASMDQVSATFTPGMLFVRTGQPVEFRNSDDTLHNVNVRNPDTKEQAFNVAIPTGEVYRHTFAKDGFYHVGCDIHPAMSAEILAASTPFATMSEPDGTFTFDSVPPGSYVLTVYAAGVKSERDVDIKGGANKLALAP